MKVSLVSITQPQGEFAGLTAEQLIVAIARVSNPKNQMNTDTAPKLLKYCLDNKHFSIFETVDLTFEIETSRAISAQILRHKSANFQEFSQRYAEVGESAFELYEARRQDVKNRQNSVDDLSEETKQWFLEAQQENWVLAYEKYQQALDLGIAKECARFLLPIQAKTRLYMKNNVRGFIHYLEARTYEGCQLEHRQIALEIQKIFVQQFPNIAEALNWK